jgi:hypothetical protein
MTQPVSHSQSLRAIGQSLELLGIQNFDIRKSGDSYVVDPGWGKLPRKLPRQEPAAKSFLKSIVKIVWGDPDEPIGPVAYSISDVNRLDLEGRSRRGRVPSMPDTHKLSQVLRVVGDYLDKKNTDDFIVSRFDQLVTVNYDVRQGVQGRERFTIDNLYDLAVHMYRRRV